MSQITLNLTHVPETILAQKFIGLEPYLLLHPVVDEDAVDDDGEPGVLVLNTEIGGGIGAAAGDLDALADMLDSLAEGLRGIAANGANFEQVEDDEEVDVDALDHLEESAEAGA